MLFDEFMADDVAMVERIYERNGHRHDCRQRAASSTRSWPRTHAGKHGRVDYDLQRDFGLDPADVRARFDYYFERFPVTAEVGVDEA